MLWFKDTKEIWRGEAIGEIRHPVDIEQKWTKAQLAKVGLEVKPPETKTQREAPPEETVNEVRVRFLENLDRTNAFIKQQTRTPDEGRNVIMSATTAEEIEAAFLSIKWGL
jgi:hypothetical protein